VSVRWCSRWAGDHYRRPYWFWRYLTSVVCFVVGHDAEDYGDCRRCF
jgi:hypothetical protein